MRKFKEEEGSTLGMSKLRYTLFLIVESSRLYQELFNRIKNIDPSLG